MPNYHINKSYDSDLRLLSDHILLIASRVDKMVANSIRALAENNIELAQETILFDKIIDKDEMLIDRQCLELLAQRQPLGQDLRFVVSVIKMVTYFERMGDLAVKICQRVIKLKSLNYPASTKNIEDMSQLVQDMLKEAIEAFLLQDNSRALSVIKQDDAIDEIYHQTTRLYIKEMASSGTETEALYHLLSIAKWLERMGDHCTNLAELIIFMIKGEDIRHQQIHNPRRSET
jgi:phosphate transport system protein